ncbi:MAG: DUF983 domain-containing protein [Planctomycetes bacterium]|nr:DUF983 domain-containing protein [Planctomycetota bacterium]
MGSRGRFGYDRGMVRRYFISLGRSLRLRCPLCGEGRLFHGWFAMHETCSGCGLKYNREPGDCLGSIYINYIMTAILVTGGYFGLYFGTDIDRDVILGVSAAFSVAFPACFFRYARSLWMGMDLFWDPPEDEDDEVR